LSRDGQFKPFVYLNGGSGPASRGCTNERSRLPAGPSCSGLSENELPLPSALASAGRRGDRM